MNKQTTQVILEKHERITTETDGQIAKRKIEEYIENQRTTGKPVIQSVVDGTWEGDLTEFLYGIFDWLEEDR